MLIVAHIFWVTLIHFKLMKIQTTYQNGYVELSPENEMEALYEKGDIVEVDYTDYLIIDYIIEENRPLYQAHTV